MLSGSEDRGLGVSFCIGKSPSEVTMFDTLEKQMEQTDGAPEPASSRVIKYIIVLVATIIVFGGLYWAVRLAE